MDGPADIRFGICELLDRTVVVVGVDAEPCRLTLDTALRVFEAARWRRMLADAFGPDEEFVRAVADSCDTDGRMNLVDGRHIASGRDWDGAARVARRHTPESYNVSSRTSEQEVLHNWLHSSRIQADSAPVTD